AEPVDFSYEALAAQGYRYGPVFQGLRQMWRHHDQVYAEVVLPTDPDRYTLHPALLDAALHAAPTEGPRLATSWHGVAVHAAGASALRVRIGPNRTGALSMLLADAVGDPVAEFVVGTTPVDARQLRAVRAAQLDALHREEWTDHITRSAPRAAHWAVVGADPLRAVAGLTAQGVPAQTYPDPDALTEAGGAAPDCLVFTVQPGAETATAVRETLSRLDALRAAEALAGVTVVFLTTSAVPAFDGAGTDLAGAAVWGLIRSAQAEEPGRFVLADLDADDEASWRVLPGAVLSGEPQTALREGRVRVPRLAPHPPASGVERGTGDDGTTLIAGAGTPMGEHLARHLVAADGVRHLVLTGAETPALAAELTGLGATVTTAPCDPVDRTALRALIGRLPAEHPLTTVVYVPEGLPGDGPAAGPPAATAPSATARTPDERVEQVRATIAAAEALDQESGPAVTLVLCSSAAGTLGGGHGAEAAAAAALDALARRRRARGAPAVSLAWGPWARGDAAARTGIAGAGVLGLPEALALFDTARHADGPVVIAARLDLTEPARRAAAGKALPPLFRSLVRPTGRRTAAAGAVSATSLRQRLASMADADRDRALSDLVATQISAVLGLEAAEAVQPHRILRELGFDSLSLLTLRNRLNSATGLRLDTASMFHRSTPDDLVEHLRHALLGT
ncbi:KR domain-containing protein, partial [Streptomyces sp. NPDC006296]|uniref:beta-ketoacyl reductase n=1 Tax=Streptomyces sp. NPDC006296 TaxID=3156746 RepID=UPI0033A91EE4